MRASGSHSVTFDGVELPPSALRGGFPVGAPGPVHGAEPDGGPVPRLGVARHRRGGARRASSAIAGAAGAGSTSRAHAMLAAENAIELAACRALFSRAAALIDEHYAANPADRRHRRGSSTALFAEAQAAKAFVNEAADARRRPALALSGGAGYLNGSPLARAYRDVRAGAFMHPLGANRAYDFVGQVELWARAGAQVGQRCRRQDTVIVCAGQAGLALSRYLARAGSPHVLLERGRIGERWRSERWDSLTLLTPELAQRPARLAGTCRPRTAFSAETRSSPTYERYADSFAAPVVDGIAVLSVGRGRGRVRVETDGRAWTAEQSSSSRRATATFPRSPPLAAVSLPGRATPLDRLPGSRRLPAGGVLVVGAGPTGQLGYALRKLRAVRAGMS